MFFKKKFVILFFAVLFIFIIATCFWIKYKEPEFKGRGYCAITNEYEKPVFYDDFISNEEADHIIQLATPLFSESKLVSGGTENVRKSETAWLPKNDATVQKIIEKVCDLTNIPFDRSEKMQVVKYQPGGFYNPHYDASCDDKKECVEFEQNGGQRVVTLIIYLNSDFTGGTTYFPNLKKEYIPKKLSALLFYSLEKNGNKCHPLSLHAGMPVKTGEKYIANVWLRENTYQIP